MVRSSLRAALAAFLLCAVTACSLMGGEEGPSPFVTAPQRSGPAQAAAPQQTPTTASPPAPGEARGQPISLAFAGDVHFEGMLASRLARDPAGALGPIAGVLRRADAAVVNLETAVTERGSPEPKAFTFRAPPAAFTALRAAGVDAASMANNHGMDFGRVGLEDSLAAARQARFPVIGIGRNAEEAFRPWRATVRGQRVAVIAATQVLDSNLAAAWTAGDSKPGLASAYQEERLVAAVQRARATADTVVVFLHWGMERHTCPTGRQQALARTLQRAGADVIVGSHAHRLQGAGWLGPSYVAYGLGNFVFYTRSGPGTHTGVLVLTVQGRAVTQARWVPARISGGIPLPLSGAAAREAIAEWHSLRGCTGLSGRPG